MNLIILLFVLGLAFVNGANYAPKGVATLAGAGVTRLSTSLLWGTLAMVVGSLLALGSAEKLTSLFYNGVISAQPDAAFAAAVLLGCMAWIALATAKRLPVSSTHSLVGALIGAGLMFDSGAVQWRVLAERIAVPLLASGAVAYCVAILLSVLASRLIRWSGRAAAAPGVRMGRLDVAHWLSSGLTALVCGLTNTGKLVAVGSFAPLPGVSPGLLVVAVTVAMAVGGLAAGGRIGHRLAHDVTRMSHAEGFTANLTTAILVGFGAVQGLPMSTTHVATGAITGCVAGSVSRLRKDTLVSFALAWLVTPLFTAGAAAVFYLLLGLV